MADNLKYWVWLSSIRQIGAVKGKKLIETFGDPRGVWDADEMDLKGLEFLTPSNIRSLKDKNIKGQAEKNFESIYKFGIKIITIKDKAYPGLLKKIYDPPIVIYSKGTLKSSEKMLAVVGSRKATPYGLSMARSISCELSQIGITIASGMAKGIDSYAHRGALDSKGRTVAVLGCGLDTVYPKENAGLMKEIAASGAVLSEYIPGVEPLQYNFPARNRIISGLSLGVIVIEAGDRSGSLITADYALEQGREVFAVPGNLDSLNSRGTNKLIKDGAKMVTSIEDILEELKIYVNTGLITEDKRIVKPKSKYYDLDDEETTLVEALERGPANVDFLAATCGFTAQTVNSLITMLELKGVVEQLPGKIIKIK